MSDTLKVFLSEQPCDSRWGNNNKVTANDDGFVIHLDQTAQVGELKLIQSCARKIQNMGVNTLTLAGDWQVEQEWAFYQGFVTAQDNQVLHWTKPHQPQLKQLKTAYDWSRKVTNLPPQDVYPMTLAHMAINFITELAPEHVSHQIVKGDDLLAQGWVGIHAVGRASVNPPLMLTIDYNPTGDEDAPVDSALVGKGITFDSGGYSIKPNEGMSIMKCDMAGAATVTAALALAILRGSNKRIKLILCCAENLIAGNAYKLGDILTYKNGTTVEILNTDAEGRLVLADGLQQATEFGAKQIIDAATLTGAALMAVGTEYNALFALDQSFAAEAQSAAAAEHESLWPLPLAPFHQQSCPSPYADTANSRTQKGGGFGGASNAAGFLSRFVKDSGKGWLHFDLASAFQISPNALYAAGATGAGIRTIARLIQ